VCTKARIPEHPHRHPREEIARVGRKDVGVSGESVSMSVSWNAGLTALHCDRCCSSPEFARNVTFDEFVGYVLWQRDHKGRVDVHWRPQYDVCRPCHINYDFLGYYETMHDDAKDVLEKIAADSGVQFPPRDLDSRLPNSGEYLELFRNVSVGDIRRILNLYENDYKVFGYKIPDAIRSKLDDEKSGNYN